MRHFVSILMLFLSCCSLLPAQSYSISEEDLSRLEQILNELWSENQKLKVDLMRARSELERLSMELRMASRELEESRNLLKRASGSWIGYVVMGVISGFVLTSEVMFIVLSYLKVVDKRGS